MELASFETRRPFFAEKMTALKVDKAVGNVNNDRPELIEPSRDTDEWQLF
jgi:putative SOS response-associated peptidase YedK